MIPVTLAGLKSAYAGGMSVREMLGDILKRCNACEDPAVWISRVSETDLMARANALDADPAAHDLPLFGVPFAVKDNIDCAALPTTAGCPAYAYQPAEDATVVARLQAAGAVLIGKTNLDQFATGLVGTRSPHGAPRSVFNRAYISGGSSSGSAVAVAAGLVAFSLGTDTAGSGRVPAGFNNIVGLKPTRGRFSTKGVVPACRSLDCVSVFANSAAEAAAIAEVAGGFDPEDPYSRTMQPVLSPPEKFRFGTLSPAARLAIGNDESAALYEAAIARLKSLGGTEIAFDYAPFAEAAALLYEGAWVAERTAAVEDFLKAHASEMDPTVRGIISGGTTLSAVDAFRGQYRLEACRRRTDAEWQKMDLMVLPTTPTHYTVAEVAADPVATNSDLGRYTNWVNLLDCCGIAIPSGFRENGLPFGITLLAPAFHDPGLTALAERFHALSLTGCGRFRSALPQTPVQAEGDGIDVFVVGAHLTGMPLNHQLTDLHGHFITEIRTSAEYRFYALPGTAPAKPGLAFAPGRDAGAIVGEIWRLTPEGFGRFVAQIPGPMGIGKVTLEDGRKVCGFICEPYILNDAEDITAFGGWRAYMATKA